jgi:nucleoside-diphosphate-sugar epimerase
VTDVAAAFVALLDSAATGAVNVGSGVGVPLRDIFAMIADRLGARELLQLGALPARDGEPDTLVADVGRLRDEIGWRPTLELASGIEDTIGWWRTRTAE